MMGDVIFGHMQKGETRGHIIIKSNARTWPANPLTSHFLPAAKPAGHRTESVVLLVVVLVVGVSLSPARYLT